MPLVVAEVLPFTVVSGRSDTSAAEEAAAAAEAASSMTSAADDLNSLLLLLLLLLRVLVEDDASAAEEDSSEPPRSIPRGMPKVLFFRRAFDTSCVFVCSGISTRLFLPPTRVREEVANATAVGAGDAAAHSTTRATAILMVAEYEQKDDGRDEPDADRVRASISARLCLLEFLMPDKSKHNPEPSVYRRCPAVLSVLILCYSFGYADLPSDGLPPNKKMPDGAEMYVGRAVRAHAPVVWAVA